MDNVDYGMESPLGIQRRKLPVPSGGPDHVDKMLDDIPYWNTMIGEIWAPSDRKLRETTHYIKQRNLESDANLLSWMCLELGEDRCLVYYRNKRCLGESEDLEDGGECLSKSLVAIGLRSRAMGLAHPTLSGTEWRVLLEFYGVQIEEALAFSESMVREAKEEAWSFVEAVAALDQPKTEIVLDNMDLIQTALDGADSNRDRCRAEHGLVEAAETWDRHRHPAFRTFAYGKIVNAVKAGRSKRDDC